MSSALRGKPCVVLSSDVRVRIEATDRTTYPDVTVVCGPRAVAADDQDAIVNPVVLVEVLSDSTEADDRGEKVAHYRRLASLREYVLVSQHERRIEVFRREGDHWSLYEAAAGETIQLGSVGAVLVVDEIYFDPTGWTPVDTTRSTSLDRELRPVAQRHRQHQQRKPYQVDSARKDERALAQRDHRTEG